MLHMNMSKVNREIVDEILKEMPESKKKVLANALDRNLMLTSARVLYSCTLVVYKEGWLVKLEGTRCSFTVFAKDNDGEFEFIRKPNENTLHPLYQSWQPMNESDYDNI